MRDTNILVTQGNYVVIAMIAGVLLPAMVMAPAAQATSLAPATESEPEPDQSSSADAQALTRETIRFLEDNWHLDAGTLVQDDDTTGGGDDAPCEPDSGPIL